MHRIYPNTHIANICNSVYGYMFAYQYVLCIYVCRQTHIYVCTYYICIHSYMRTHTDLCMSADIHEVKVYLYGAYYNQAMPFLKHFTYHLCHSYTRRSHHLPSILPGEHTGHKLPLGAVNLLGMHIILSLTINAGTPLPTHKGMEGSVNPQPC